MQEAIAGQTGASQPVLCPFKVRPNSKHFFFGHSPAPAARPEAGDHFGGGARAESCAEAGALRRGARQKVRRTVRLGESIKDRGPGNRDSIRVIAVFGGNRRVLIGCSAIRPGVLGGRGHSGRVLYALIVQRGGG